MTSECVAVKLETVLKERLNTLPKIGIMKFFHSLFPSEPLKMRQTKKKQKKKKGRNPQ